MLSRKASYDAPLEMGVAFWNCPFVLIVFRCNSSFPFPCCCFFVLFCFVCCSRPVIPFRANTRIISLREIILDLAWLLTRVLLGNSARMFRRQFVGMPWQVTSTPSVCTLCHVWVHYVSCGDVCLRANVRDSVFHRLFYFKYFIVRMYVIALHM